MTAGGWLGPPACQGLQLRQRQMPSNEGCPLPDTHAPQACRAASSHKQQLLALPRHTALGVAPGINNLSIMWLGTLVLH